MANASDAQYHAAAAAAAAAAAGEPEPSSCDSKGLEEQRLRELVTEWFKRHTGRKPTDDELAELIEEVDEDLQAEISKLDLQARESAQRAARVADTALKNAAESRSRLVLVVGGVMLGIMAQFANNQHSSEPWIHIDRRHDSSWPQKAVCALFLLLGHILSRRLRGEPPHSDHPVSREISSIETTFLSRYFLLLLMLLKRHVPWWEALATGLGMLVLQPLFAWLALQSPRQKRTGLLARGPFLLALAGAMLSTVAEFQRHAWLHMHPNTLFTGGLFQFARHINYTGELLLFLGWALCTRSRAALLLPAFFATTFWCIYIPDLDRHLLNKYGNLFARYQVRTPALIPFVV